MHGAESMGKRLQACNSLRPGKRCLGGHTSSAERAVFTISSAQHAHIRLPHCHTLLSCTWVNTLFVRSTVLRCHVL